MRGKFLPGLWVKKEGAVTAITASSVPAADCERSAQKEGQDLRSGGLLRGEFAKMEQQSANNVE